MWKRLGYDYEAIQVLLWTTNVIQSLNDRDWQEWVAAQRHNRYHYRFIGKGVVVLLQNAG